jgi:dienelactone hydrolase
MRFATFAVVLALGGAAATAQADVPRWAAAGRQATIPVHEASGDVAQMETTFFLPSGPGPFPVVVFSHGRASGAEGRAAVQIGVSRSQLDYWLAKGVAVVSPVRPGYGHSSGGDVEDSGVHHDSAGRCTNRPDFRKTAAAAALTVDATLAWLHDQPWADPRDVLLVGQSVGGLATVGAGAQGLPGVVGYVNFAGGTGGNPERSPGHSCDPAQLEAIFAADGQTTHVPSLWIYAVNDQYWGPDQPVAWHAAFARGGSDTRFVHAPPVADDDGHGLSRHAAALWAPEVDSFLAHIGFPAKASTPAGRP